MMPLVSVLMTAYNREKYIGAAIESVLASEFSDFELIIVDDCSADDTLKIAKTYEASDKRIKVYINEKNIGDYPNRNMAASYASGKYLKYLDSDDLIYKHGLEIMVSGMEKFPNAGLGVSSNSMQQKFPFPILSKVEDSMRRHFFKDGFLNVGPSGTIIKREVFESLKGFSGKRMIGDTEMWLKIAMEFPVVITSPSLIFWREHDQQEYFAGVNSGIYLEMNLPFIQEIMSLSNCTLKSEEKNRILKYYRTISARSVLNLAVKKRDVSKAIRIKKLLKLTATDFFNAVFNIKKQA